MKVTGGGRERIKATMKPNYNTVKVPGHVLQRDHPYPLSPSSGLSLWRRRSSLHWAASPPRVSLQWVSPPGGWGDELRPPKTSKRFNETEVLENPVWEE